MADAFAFAFTFALAFGKGTCAAGRFIAFTSEANLGNTIRT